MSQAIWCCCYRCHFISGEPQQTHSRKQKWNRGIPPWQRASCPHKRTRSSVSKQRREARSWFIRGELLLHLLWMRLLSFSSRSGPTLTRKSALAPGACTACTPASVFGLYIGQSSTPGGFVRLSVGSILPDLSVPWSPHQPGPERRKGDGVEERPFWPTPPLLLHVSCYLLCNRA